jgi:hypothetical protein
VQIEAGWQVRCHTSDVQAEKAPLDRCCRQSGTSGIPLYARAPVVGRVLRRVQPRPGGALGTFTDKTRSCTVHKQTPSPSLSDVIRQPLSQRSMNPTTITATVCDGFG